MPHPILSLYALFVSRFYVWLSLSFGFSHRWKIIAILSQVSMSRLSQERTVFRRLPLPKASDIRQVGICRGSLVVSMPVSFKAYGFVNCEVTLIVMVVVYPSSPHIMADYIYCDRTKTNQESAAISGRKMRVIYLQCNRQTDYNRESTFHGKALSTSWCPLLPGPGSPPKMLDPIHWGD